MTFNTLKDGMGGEEVRTGSLAGAAEQNPYFTGSMTVLSGLVVAKGGLTVSAGGITDDVGALSAAGTGSPTTWGRAIQAGAGTTGGGSNLWVSYGTAFGSAPNVVATSAETQETILVKTGSIVVGSFYVESKTASQDFQWIAVGPAA